MRVTPFGMLMLVKPAQSENAKFPMLVTLSGIVTFPEQAVPSIKISFTITNGLSFCLFINQGVPENADPPMLVTLLGIVMFAKLLQPENAPVSMLVILSGILILVKAAQL